MKYLIITLFMMSCEVVILPPENPGAPINEIIPEITSDIVEMNTSQFLVYSSYTRFDYHVSNTTDGNDFTFMTTNTLSMDERFEIAWRMDRSVDLDKIEVRDNYTYDYNLGDLVVYVSNNSTDGFDGSWEYVTEMKYDTKFGWVSGTGQISINKTNVQWVKFEMTYRGTGAHGGTPAFYISEVKFWEAK